MSETDETSQLPQSWKWATVGEIADTSSGGTPSRARNDYYNGSIPWVKSGELRDRTVFQAEESITELGLSSSSAKIFPKGTLCIALYGATVGKLGILGIDAATNQAVCGIFVPPLISTQYLYYYLAWKRRSLIDQGKGGAQPNISQDIVRRTAVPLAPLSEQRRIVSKIEELFTKLDAGVEALTKARAQLKRYRQSVLKAAVTGELTREWREAHRGELETASELLALILRERREKWEADQLAKMQAAGKTPKNDDWKKKYVEPASPDKSYLSTRTDRWTCATWDQLSNWVTYGFTRPMPHVEEGLPIVTAKNIVNRRINFSNTHKTPLKEFSKLSDKDRPKAGDILITKDGAIGRAGVVETDEPFCINQSVAVVWLRSCPVERKFLLYVIESPLTQKPILEKARGVAIQHLSITDFAKMTLPLPPLGEQQQIVSEVERLLSIADAAEQTIEQSLKKAERLRQSILKRAFEGKLVPQDPADETAEMLLARIRAERVQNGTRPQKPHHQPRKQKQNTQPGLLP